MKKIIPEKLKSGDEIRVIAPARGLKMIGADCREIAKKRFEAMGLKVSFAKNTNDENWDMLGSSSVEKRVEDIMDAFKDENVKAIFTIMGGFSSNQILPYLDYEVIKANPKILCGYSDITALLNAISNKTGMVTYYGPHYSSFGMEKGFDYTMQTFKKMLLETGRNEIVPSSEWSDDLWFLDQENREFITNDGYWVLQSGVVKGKIIGGHLGTLNLLLGSEFMPKFEQDTILFIEDCFHCSSDDNDFLRNLQSLSYQPDFANVKGIVIGRFQKASNISREKLEYMISVIKVLHNIPIIANVDFGHTTPFLTLPIFGTAEINSADILIED